MTQAKHISRSFRIQQLTILLALTAILTSCGGRVRRGTGASCKTDETGRKAFVTHVYPLFIAESRCVSCHGIGKQVPSLANASDSTVAYNAALPYFNNLNSPKDSKLYLQASKGHCNSSKCTDQDGKIRQAVEQWAKAESTAPTTCQENGENGETAKEWKTVGTVAATSTVSQSGKSYLVFDLSSLGSNGSKIAFEIGNYEGVGYQISNPSLVSDKAHHIEGIHLAVVNGTQKAEYSTWDKLSMDVGATSALPGTILDTKFVIAERIAPMGDSFELKLLKFSDPKGPVQAGKVVNQTQTTISFQNDVYPIIQGHCSGCHTGAVTTGKNFSTAAAVINAGVVIRGDWAKSLLYSKINDGAMPPPDSGRTKPNDLALSTIKAWIQAGAPNN